MTNNENPITYYTHHEVLVRKGVRTDCDRVESVRPGEIVFVKNLFGEEIEWGCTSPRILYDEGERAIDVRATLQKVGTPRRRWSGRNR